VNPITTDFFQAIRAGNRDEVEHLLLLHPELIHAREKGLSPALLAAYHLEPNLANFLADKIATLSVFEAAAIGRITHLVRLLARDPELVNSYSDDGFQPLGLACFFGHLDAADYLVRAGANVNSASNNEQGFTPLHSAVAGRHIPIMKMLLKNGANPNVRDGSGNTPLHTAAFNGDLESIQALILGGADLKIRNANGKIPFDLAAEKGRVQAAELLKREITKRFRPSAIF